ncbi:MAG TPA: GxxExxY protein [Chloroflexi bacterium]|nr:GxxExxY protein [Chloroflexota bacterium]
MHSDLTDKIINAFYKVYNQLGYGFLEKVYENALAIELRKRGHDVAQQVSIDVYYDGVIVGEYKADLLVGNLVLCELKATRKLAKEHEAQILNYLKATSYEVGLLLNFGPKPEIKRRATSNKNKPYLLQSKKS